MKKADQKKLSETLDKALAAPPRRMPKQALDSLLNEYDDAESKRLPSLTGVPQYSSTAAQGQNNPLIEPIIRVSENIVADTTGVPEYRSTAAAKQSPIPTREFYRKSNQTADHIDRQLTPAESKVLDHLLRLSVGFNKDRCQVRVSVLMNRTGYRSDKTVRAALSGLETKGVITRLSHSNSPAGDEYVIQPYSGNTGVPEYRSTAAENTVVLESKVTGQLNTDIKDKNKDDDAALAGLISELKSANMELTGKEISIAENDRWKELAQVIIAELKIAAARTTVSSVPAFLAEHLRRRLWKIDKKQAKAEGRELPDEAVTQVTFVDSSKCLDCGGSGWWYPEGESKGVAKCKHEKLTNDS
jgi:DNA-binding HxlR family transcriptional regulator